MKAKIISALQLVVKIVKAVLYVLSFGHLCSCEGEKCKCAESTEKDSEK